MTAITEMAEMTATTGPTEMTATTATTMEPLTPGAVLEIWEQGEARSPTRSALRLLAVACPQVPWEELCALPLGERDRRLLEWRRLSLGENLEARGRCPACSQAVEFTLRASALLQRVEPPAGGELEVQVHGTEVRLRPPTSADLLAVEGAGSVDEARRLLVARCVVEVARDDEVLDSSQLEPRHLEALGDALGAADPGAELLLTLCCPACEEGWQEVFDVASYLRGEIAVLAQGLLQEVHTLARAYGWAEADILGMSRRRRRAYLARLER